MPVGSADNTTIARSDVMVADRAIAHSAMIRRLTWALLPVLGAAYYLIVVSALPGTVKLVPLEIIYSAPIAVTVAFSFIARHRSEGVERSFWGSLGTANAILLGCELLLTYWVLAIDAGGPPPVSWPFHIMHAIAAVFFIRLLLAMSRFNQSTSGTKLRLGFDIAAALVVVAVAITELYSRPIMEPAGASIGEILLGTGYPLFGTLMLTGTLGNVVGFKVGRWRVWDRLVAVSLSVYAMAIMLWPMWYPTAVETSRNYERGVLDLVQFGGHWLLMAAAVYRMTESTGWRIRPLPPFASTRRWVSLILPTASVVAIPTILWFALRVHRDDAWFGVYAGAATLLTLFVLARSLVMTLENGVLFDRSITDPLTGAYNHRFFHSHLSQQLDTARRYEEPMALLVFDIDEFGRFNERFGHASGDRLLAEVAGIMRSACAASCTVSRLGGDEFAIVAPEMDATSASLLGARLLDMISIEAGNSPGAVSVSAGIAVFPDHASNAENLYRLADGALFHSKETGKARLTLFNDERVPDLSARERMERLQHQSRLASVRALAAAADARDSSAHDHSRAVAQLAGRIARAMDLEEDVVRRIEMGSLLHEVGRIAVPDPATSDVPRGRVIDESQRHPILGQQILMSAGLADLAPMARSHHEHWDGSGYPDGLAGGEIPIEARVLSAADYYDALVSGLGEGIARTPAQALLEVEARAGAEFDPQVVRALGRLVAERPLIESA